METSEAASDWNRQSGAPGVDEDDWRPAQRKDRDRIFYSDEFARLEGVTQVVASRQKSARNRLTHSYRVEQVARSIAGKLRAEGHSSVDDDVVMAASLAHDIGHAPFGHTGEEALQRAVMCDRHFHHPEDFNFEGREPQSPTSGVRVLACTNRPPCDLTDGFEGNAQSFRIIARLAAKFSVTQPDSVGEGLDLTRRVLRATLKYPWVKQARADKPAKWGVYDSDVTILQWAFEDSEESVLFEQSIESQIMDAADDIAYAVHDLEDFYKSGDIPLESIEVGLDDNNVLSSIMDYIRNEKDEIGSDDIQNLVREWDRYLHEDSHRVLDESSGEYPYLAELENFITRFPDIRYVDGVEGRREVSKLRSSMISSFIAELQIDDETGRLTYRRRQTAAIVEFLKQLTWFFVIDNPRLRAVRVGQAAIVTEAYHRLRDEAWRLWVSNDADTGQQDWLSPTIHDLRGLDQRLTSYITIGRQSAGRYLPTEVVARAVVDYICSLTDEDLSQYVAQLRGDAVIA